MSSVLQDAEDLDALYRQIIDLHTARKHAQAIPLAERYAEAMKACHGVDHPQYGAALSNLAQQLLAADRLAEAEPLMRRALAVIEKSPGAKHSELARALTNLAELLLRTNRPGEALPLLRRVLTIIEQHPREGSHAVLRDLTEMIDTDRLAEAVSLMRRLVAIAVTEPRGEGFLLASFAGQLDHVHRELAKPTDPELRERMEAELRERLEAERRRLEAENERALRAALARLDVGLASIIPNRPIPTPQRALEIEAGRLAYQIPRRMWRGVTETVEVRLGRLDASDFRLGFVGRGGIRTEHVPIVETMAVSLVCEPGAFHVVARSKEEQLVKPDIVKGTAFHQTDFGKWIWLVTPRKSGEHTLLVKVSARIRDSRDLPSTATLPDKIIGVTVQVNVRRAVLEAARRAAPHFAWAIVTALVGVFTRDYWWPTIRDTWWPAVQAMVGMQ